MQVKFRIFKLRTRRSGVVVSSVNNVVHHWTRDPREHQEKDPSFGAVPTVLYLLLFNHPRNVKKKEIKRCLWSPDHLILIC